jgi:hypothetical protein
MAKKNTDTLLKAIELKYGSLEQPDFTFVNKTVLDNPYFSLLNELKIVFEVEEITDINDDVSFQYVLSTSGKQWVIQVSMIGLYAIVLKILDDGDLEFVRPDSSTIEEQKIISLLLENQFSILKQEILEYPCSLKLFNTESENVCIYQALFSDTDILPWKQ